MVLKVDLQCPCCYKKVKKIICKFPEIRDQVYKEKENKVVITVVCCNPEKIRDKLCCKGAKVIKSIEIVEPEKPKPPKPIEPKPKPVEPHPPKEPEKPIEKPPPEKPIEKPPPEKPKPDPKPEPKPPAPAPVIPAPAPAPPPPEPIPGPGHCGCPPVSPVRNCCGPCSQGWGGGPCYLGHGPPTPMPQPCFDGYYVYGCHDRPCHVTRCDYYFSEENPQACSIM